MNIWELNDAGVLRDTVTRAGAPAPHKLEPHKLEPHKLEPHNVGPHLLELLFILDQRHAEEIPDFS